MHLWLEIGVKRVFHLWVFWILPGNPLISPKSSQKLRVGGDHRPFSRRYWVVDGDSTIAPGEFPKSLTYYDVKAAKKLWSLFGRFT